MKKERTTYQYLVELLRILLATLSSDSFQQSNSIFLHSIISWLTAFIAGCTETCLAALVSHSCSFSSTSSRPVVNFIRGSVTRNDSILSAMFIIWNITGVWEWERGRGRERERGRERLYSSTYSYKIAYNLHLRLTCRRRGCSGHSDNNAVILHFTTSNGSIHL